MTKRSYTIGALAATAILAVPALASANVSVTCAPNPDYLRITSSNHPAGAIVALVTQDGLPFDSRTLPGDGSYDVPAPDGPTYTASTEQYGYTFSSAPFVKACHPPVVPPPTLIPEQPQPQPEQPQVVTPKPKQPKVKRPPVRRVKITCAYLRKVKAGPREYTKRGWFYRCVAPPKPKRPSHIPVTG